MIDLSTLKKAWALLDDREQRNAWIVLAVVLLGAMSSAVMVGSVLPFLSVLSDPSRIESTAALAWAYQTFGFTSGYSFLIGLGVVSLAVIVLTSLVQILKTWAVARFSMMRAHSISYKLMAAYLRQPYEFFLNRHSGEMSTRILAESQQVVSQCLGPAADLIAGALTILAVISLLLFVDPVVTLAAFSVLGGAYVGIYTLNRRLLKALGRTRFEANKIRFRVAHEALGGIKDIKLLGRETSYVARYAEPSQRMARTIVAVQLISQVPQFLLQAVAYGGIILLCVIMMDEEGLASGAGLGSIVPILGVFAFAGQRLMPELSKVYRSLAQLQASAAAVDSIYDDLMDHAAGGALPKTTPAGLGVRNYFELSEISYRYPGADRAGVKDITVKISAGDRIGIVGGTGAGKTTLADLILGLLVPEKGSIAVDGTPVTESNLRAWQQSVGYVPQEIFLTDASVSENIALGIPKDQIDQNRVEEAARIARLDQFICDELPEGYATEIGERGVRLSGGQRQRIGIARALYHEADLIVFDEATSALDNLTERDVMAAIDALPNEKTVVLIAHRLSTVRKCDKIIVMDGGQIVGYDHWDTLMASNAAFQRIAKLGEAA